MIPYADGPPPLIPVGGPTGPPPLERIGEAEESPPPLEALNPVVLPVGVDPELIAAQMRDFTEAFMQGGLATAAETLMLDGDELQAVLGSFGMQDIMGHMDIPALLAGAMVTEEAAALAAYDWADTPSARSGKEVTKEKWGVMYRASTEQGRERFFEEHELTDSMYQHVVRWGLRPLIPALLGVRIAVMTHAAPPRAGMGGLRNEFVEVLFSNPFNRGLTLPFALRDCGPTLVVGLDAPFTFADAAALGTYLMTYVKPHTEAVSSTPVRALPCPVCLSDVCAAADSSLVDCPPIYPPIRPFLSLSSSPSQAGRIPPHFFQPSLLRKFMTDRLGPSGAYHTSSMHTMARARVRLSGLQKAAHLNGTEGWLYGNGPVREDRWSVKLDATGKTAAVRDEAIDLAEEPEDPSPLLSTDGLIQLSIRAMCQPTPPLAGQSIPLRFKWQGPMFYMPQFGPFILKRENVTSLEGEVKPCIMLHLPRELDVSNYNNELLTSLIGNDWTSLAGGPVRRLTVHVPDSAMVDALGMRLPPSTMWFGSGEFPEEVFPALVEQGIVYDLGFRVMGPGVSFKAMEPNL